MKKVRKPPIENIIYKSIIGICEGREYNGSYHGNGHHLAQELCVKVAEGLLPKNQRKIYDAMSKTPMTVKEICEIVNMPSRTVSSQLINIKESCLLIGNKLKDKKNKLWYRYYDASN